MIAIVVICTVSFNHIQVIRYNIRKQGSISKKCRAVSIDVNDQCVKVTLHQITLLKSKNPSIQFSYACMYFRWNDSWWFPRNGYFKIDFESNIGFYIWVFIINLLYQYIFISMISKKVQVHMYFKWNETFSEK